MLNAFKCSNCHYNVEILDLGNDVSDIDVQFPNLSTLFISWRLLGPGGAVMALPRRSSSVTTLQCIVDDAAPYFYQSSLYRVTPNTVSCIILMCFIHSKDIIT